MGENDFLDIYFDSSATTKPCKAAVDEALKLMITEYGNPSSLHAKGFEAMTVLEQSRKTVAASVCAEPKEIYFTQSGTVANNTAVFGAVNSKRHQGNKIVTTATEHPSVARCMDALESQGYEIIRLKPSADGNIPIDAFEQAIDGGTVLVSAMAVNNETGAILPFEKLKAAAKKKNSDALIHVDAVQAYMKLPLNPAKSGIDLMSVSAHKVHALKGAGALYVSKNIKIKPYVLGGGQEQGLVSGTQSMPNIAAFAAAVSFLDGIKDRNENVKRLNTYLRNKLEKFDFVKINSPDNALPYILNISLPGLPSQVGVNFFSGKGICLSAGSACSRGHRSDTLTSMGLDTKLIDSALRISFSYDSTEGEIDYFADCLPEAVKLVK